MGSNSESTEEKVDVAAALDQLGNRGSAVEEDDQPTGGNGIKNFQDLTHKVIEKVREGDASWHNLVDAAVMANFNCCCMETDPITQSVDQAFAESQNAAPEVNAPEVWQPKLEASLAQIVADNEGQDLKFLPGWTPDTSKFSSTPVDLQALKEALALQGNKDKINLDPVFVTMRNEKR